jgi:hypothetical protein
MGQFHRHLLHQMLVLRIVPTPYKPTPERQRGVVSVVQIHPLTQVDRRVKRRNATRKSEIPSGSPSKNVPEAKNKKTVTDEEKKQEKATKNILKVQREEDFQSHQYGLSSPY